MPLSFFPLSLPLSSFLSIRLWIPPRLDGLHPVLLLLLLSPVSTMPSNLEPSPFSSTFRPPGGLLVALHGVRGWRDHMEDRAKMCLLPADEKLLARKRHN